MSSKVMERRDWWKNLRQNDERRLFWTIFWNIWKNNVRMLAEDRELFIQQQTSATSTTLFRARKALPDASNIVTNFQKNRYTSFISCLYNLRRLSSSSVWKTMRAGAVRNRSKLYQLFAVKLTSAGTMFHWNSPLHMWTLETHYLLSVPKIVHIDQYLLKSFENITGVRFLWTTVYMQNILSHHVLCG